MCETVLARRTAFISVGMGRLQLPTRTYKECEATHPRRPAVSVRFSKPGVVENIGETPPRASGCSIDRNSWLLRSRRARYGDGFPEHEGFHSKSHTSHVLPDLRTVNPVPGSPFLQERNRVPMWHFSPGAFACRMPCRGNTGRDERRNSRVSLDHPSLLRPGRLHRHP